MAVETTKVGLSLNLSANAGRKSTAPQVRSTRRIGKRGPLTLMIRIRTTSTALKVFDSYVKEAFAVLLFCPAHRHAHRECCSLHPSLHYTANGRLTPSWTTLPARLRSTPRSVSMDSVEVAKLTSTTGTPPTNSSSFSAILGGDADKPTVMTIAMGGITQYDLVSSSFHAFLEEGYTLYILQRREKQATRIRIILKITRSISLYFGKPDYPRRVCRRYAEGLFVYGSSAVSHFQIYFKPCSL